MYFNLYVYMQALSQLTLISVSYIDHFILIKHEKEKERYTV